MKLFKLHTALIFIIFLTSCGTIKSGFSNQKKNNSDEFLVEKKSPLIMPPDYNELPVPKDPSMEIKTSKNEIKSLITKTDNDRVNENLEEKSSTFENSILKKIKNN